MRAHPFPPRTLPDLILWAFSPVLVCELALSPFWFANVYADHAWLPTAQLLFTAVLLPLYLAALGVMFVWRSNFSGVLLGLGIVIVSVVLTVFLDYTVWGVSTRQFWDPDSETVLIIRIAGEVAFAVALFPPLVALALRYTSQYARRNA